MSTSIRKNNKTFQPFVRSSSTETGYQTTADNFLTNEGINVFEAARKEMMELGKQMNSTVSPRSHRK